jgi:hypothetical protein
VADDHTLTCREAIRFHHERAFVVANVGLGLHEVVADVCRCCRNAMVLHKRLGESLTRFELCGSPGRTKDTQAVLGKGIGNPEC